VAITFKQEIAAWLVHAFTASTAIVGVYTLKAIVDQKYILAFLLMGIAVIVDALDGTLARLVHTHVATPKIDGALLDNLVDFINYLITPTFLLLMHPSLLPPTYRHIIISLILLASAYQFTQRDAKTSDHFFKGFPSYWNFAVFYLFILETSPITNSFILLILATLVFVPIKYVYPSRLDYLTRTTWLRKMMLSISILFGILNVVILWIYPKLPMFLSLSIIAYLCLYFGLSLYRTFVPLAKNV
jgi:phosphatidylcholine synthase